MSGWFGVPFNPDKWSSTVYVFKNIKPQYFSDFTGPSSGSTLVVFVWNSYYTIFCSVGYVEELVGV